jgi:hypothetical protein
MEQFWRITNENHDTIQYSINILQGTQLRQFSFKRQII